MVCTIPLGCSTVLAQLVADILDAAEDRKHLAARAAVLGTELAGEALAVSEVPVDDQPGQLLAVDVPAPGRPDWPRFAIVGTMGRRFASWLVVAGRQQDLTTSQSSIPSQLASAACTSRV